MAVRAVKEDKVHGVQRTGKKGPSGKDLTSPKNCWRSPLSGRQRVTESEEWGPKWKPADIREVSTRPGGGFPSSDTQVKGVRKHKEKSP